MKRHGHHQDAKDSDTKIMSLLNCASGEYQSAMQAGRYVNISVNAARAKVFISFTKSPPLAGHRFK